MPEECPEGHAAICPKAGKLPDLAPGLSATVRGGRVALAGMAERLGKPDEAALWQEKAETIRELILTHCHDPGDECFYDLGWHRTKYRRHLGAVPGATGDGAGCRAGRSPAG